MYIPSAEVNSDLGIVNAARVSLAKHSQWVVELDGSVTLGVADAKLIHYLAVHNHWTPFAHSRLYFEVEWGNQLEELMFYRGYNPSGFSIYNKTRMYGATDYIKGSLYSWLSNINHFNQAKQDAIYEACIAQHPVAAQALCNYTGYEFHSRSGVRAVSEDWLIYNGFWHVACATLRLQVPIFIARQIRTSQVGFAYSDSYVEGEAFAYNEVSHVSDELEFYEIPEWRKRDAGKVKQGSTFPEQLGLNMAQDEIIHNARSYYYTYATRDVAPEQLRALLPQSMYTEFYMTGTLHRWAQWLALRLQADAQEETRQIAQLVLDTLTEQFPQWAEAYRS